MEEIKNKAHAASNFLKGLANPHRLLILCELAQGERTVTQLIEASGLAQTSMSQHLKKLKSEGIIEYRRDHRTLYYRIIHPHVQDIMDVLYEAFCKGDKT